jgi:hypothetical protein
MEQQMTQNAQKSELIMLQHALLSLSAANDN